jgi:hypothetical protein
MNKSNIIAALTQSYESPSKYVKGEINKNKKIHYNGSHSMKGHSHRKLPQWTW